MLWVGRSITSLFHHRDLSNRGQLWTGLWAPRHRALLGPHLQLCSLKEGQRILLAISSWATGGVIALWEHIKDHLAAQEPLHPLPTALPDTFAEPPEPYASDTDPTPPDPHAYSRRGSPAPSQSATYGTPTSATAPPATVRVRDHRTLEATASHRSLDSHPTT